MASLLDKKGNIPEPNVDHNSDPALTKGAKADDSIASKNSTNNKVGQIGKKDNYAHNKIVLNNLSIKANMRFTN